MNSRQFWGLCALAVLLATMGYGISQSAKHESSQSAVNCTPRPMKALALDTRERGWGGSFFLGIGSIGGGGETDYYYFYAKDPRTGGYVLEKKILNEVEVFEDEEDAPYAVYACGLQSKRLWALHIPPNSIRSFYELDIENIDGKEQEN